MFDDGSATTRDIDLMENVYGFPDGITGPGLVARGRKYTHEFGAELVPEAVVRIPRTDDEGYSTTESSTTSRSITDD